MEPIFIGIAPPLAFHELGQRANNEDSLYPPCGQATASDRLFLVCDGIGGAQKGELASEMVCQQIAAFFANTGGAPSTPEMVQQAVAQAQAALVAYAAAHPEAKGMGTTLTLLHLHTNGATLAHIGDSRIYHFRAGHILHQTWDHTLVNQWVAHEIITPEEARNHPRRNVLVRAISDSEKHVVADTHLITDLQPADCFLLCTDGVLEHLDEQTLCHIFSQENSWEEKMEAVKNHGKDINRDNFSAYLVPIQAVVMGQTARQDAPQDARQDAQSESSPPGLLTQIKNWFNQ